MRNRTDPNLVSEVRKYGKFDANACLQCGSCTIVCDLATFDETFPRKTLRYALLGLKDQLKGRLEPWSCYYCGDCSEKCPRQAEPAESLMTIRRYLSAQYDWTGLSAKIHKSVAWEIGSLVFIALIVLALVAYYHLTSEIVTELGGVDYLITTPMGLEHMFGLINTFTTIVFILPIFFLLTNTIRMCWFAMHYEKDVRIPFYLYITEIKTFLYHAFYQKLFKDCSVRKRWMKHLILVGACLIMLIIKFFFLSWFQTDSIYPVSHPQRWLGYLSAGIIIYTAVEILYKRIRKEMEIHRFSNSSDWIFPIMLLLTALSGIAVHIFRYLSLELTTHFAYAIHLAIAVPLLVIEIPFGKWSHVMYRPLAIYLQVIKEKAKEVQNKKELVFEHGS